MVEENTDEQKIMVVKEKDLFGENGEFFFQGFRSHEEIDYEQRILKNFGFITRGFAENDSNHKQPIAYTLIVNPSLKKIFAYQRASTDKHYSEKRLQGKWSLGVGGHINLEDIQEDAANPIKVSLERELGKEEVEFINGRILALDVLGYIYDDSNSVGKVHFGILYLAKTDAKIVKPKDSEIAFGELMNLSRLEEIMASTECEVEGWSKIAFEPLRKYLEKI